MKKSRRDFLEKSVKGAVAIASIGVVLSHKSQEGKMKLLTENGQLVEISEEDIRHSKPKGKVSADEIHNWVKHNNLNKDERKK